MGFVLGHLLAGTSAADKSWVQLEQIEAQLPRVQWLFIKFVLIFLAAVKLAFQVALALGMRLFRRRIVVIRADTIGTLVTSTSLWLSDLECSKSPERVLVLPLTWICNREVWSRFNRVSPRVHFCTSITVLGFLELLGNAHNGFSIYIHRVTSQRLPWFRKCLYTPEYDYGGLEFPARVAREFTYPLSRTTTEHEIAVFRESLGIPFNKMIAVIVDRDSSVGTPTNLRNSPPEVVRAVATHLLEQGWFVIRAGRSRSEEIEIDSDNWLDYAFSGARSDHADFFLAASADAVVGWNTGLTDLYISLEVPTLFFTHFVPRAMPNVLNSIYFFEGSHDAAPTAVWSLGAPPNYSYRDLTELLQTVDNPTLLERIQLRQPAVDVSEYLTDLQEFLTLDSDWQSGHSAPATMVRSLNRNRFANQPSHSEERYSLETLFVTRRTRLVWQQTVSEL